MATLKAMFGLGTPELLILLLIIFLLFGARKLPEAFTGLGKGIRNLKKAMNEDESTDKPGDKKDSPPKAS